MKVIKIPEPYGTYQGKKYLAKTAQFFTTITKDDVELSPHDNLNRFIEEKEKEGYIVCLEYWKKMVPFKPLPHMEAIDRLIVRMAFLKL